MRLLSCFCRIFLFDIMVTRATLGGIDVICQFAKRKCYFPSVRTDSYCNGRLFSARVTWPAYLYLLS